MHMTLIHRVNTTISRTPLRSPPLPPSPPLERPKTRHLVTLDILGKRLGERVGNLPALHRKAERRGVLDLPVRLRCEQLSMSWLSNQWNI